MKLNTQLLECLSQAVAVLTNAQPTVPKKHWNHTIYDRQNWWSWWRRIYLLFV